MNEELRKVLTEILNGALTAKDFILAELPEVVQQLLLWKFWLSITYNVVGISISILSIVLARKLYKYIDGIESNTYDMDGVKWFSVLVLIPTIPALVEGLNLTWLQIWVAPKIYLIEYAASLAK